MIKILIAIFALSFGLYGQTELQETAVKKQFTISVKDKAEADKLEISKIETSDAVYDDVKKTLTFSANEVGPKMSWRLIHDGKRVLALMHTKGFTATIHKILEADTPDKCLEEIKRLGLIDDREVKEEDIIINTDIKEVTK